MFEEDEEEEDGMPPRIKQACYRCGTAEGINPFSLEGEVLEGRIAGALCRECARAVLATIQNQG